VNEWIERRLPELLEEHGVVGAQVAVLHNGEIVDAAAGVRHNVTNEPVTGDTLFQIGSITKVWTATLIMQLVNEGLLDLDRPVRDVLPEFRLADEQAARVITPRQLLCHTAGFEGDLWFDTGDGDDMLARYLDILADVAQVSPPGELYSYCNNGYVVLGRIIEVSCGKPYHAVVRERLVDVLGLTVATRRAEYALHRTAEGHLAQDGELKPVTDHMPESNAPAGTVLAMSARDLLRFVRMHLETTELDAMREPQVTHPDFGAGEWWWCLGWELPGYEGGKTVLGHSGLTMGYTALLHVVSEAGVAVAVLTNGGQNPWALSGVIFDHLLDELAGARPRAFAGRPEEEIPVDATEVAGLYRCSALDLHITPGENGRVLVRQEPTNHFIKALMPISEREYTMLRDDALISVEKPHDVIVLCGRDEEGRVKWAHWGRAAVRR
jgi:CubicO group peptidase (beta-lactamase class C family)